MEIVTTSGDSTITIIPRNDDAYISVHYRNVSTDKTLITNNTAGVYTDNSLVFVFLDADKTTLKIKEGQFVHFEIYGSSTEEDPANNLLYRGRMFIADQSISQTSGQVYDLNQGDYTEQQSDNEYIIY